jgi:hypothetical protein
LKSKKDESADNEKELRLLQERLGIDKSISPDELKVALKQLVSKRVIADYKIKKEKS